VFLDARTSPDNHDARCSEGRALPRIGTEGLVVRLAVDRLGTVKSFNDLANSGTPSTDVTFLQFD